MGGRLLVMIPDVENTAGMPSGFTRRKGLERIFEFQDIYNLIFQPQGFPESVFVDVQISSGTVGATPVLFFNLGLASESPGVS